jgi:hypothetical protein
MLSFVKDMTEKDRNRSILFNVVILLFCIWASSSLGNSSPETNSKNISTTQIFASYKFSHDIQLPRISFLPDFHKIFVESVADSQFYSLQLYNELAYEQMQSSKLKQLEASYLRIKPEQIFRSVSTNYDTSKSVDYPEIS